MLPRPSHISNYFMDTAGKICKQNGRMNKRRENKTKKKKKIEENEWKRKTKATNNNPLSHTLQAHTRRHWSNARFKAFAHKFMYNNNFSLYFFSLLFYGLLSADLILPN